MTQIKIVFQTICVIFFYNSYLVIKANKFTYVWPSFRNIVYLDLSIEGHQASQIWVPEFQISAQISSKLHAIPAKTSSSPRK